MTSSAASRPHPLAAALHDGFAAHRDAVLQAPTGAGKSTLVPLALLEEPFVAGKKILMLEPRRLAARAVAARMAALRGERVGATVGYRMRLDTRVSRETRIEVVTEGVLTRMLQEDPTLEDVCCLIFDEYHERSLQADLGLALALDARRQLDAAFRVLIMSATLEADRVAVLLDDAAMISVPGRAFPVDIHYLGRGLPLLPGPGEFPERAVAPAVQRALADTDGDVLVFLPGVGEIRRVENLLMEAALPAGVRLLPLFGEMSAEAQDAVLAPLTAGARKVVLATNVAETSLTIPGITAVVDSGLVRRARFDPATGMGRLELQRISRASSDQRAGRAGRTAPGHCYRLWSEGAQVSLAASTTPEMLDADLAPLALELARWGSADSLRWLDPPPEAALQQANELLQRLDALDAQGRLTAGGRELSRLAVHPRLAHMLFESRRLNAVELAAQLAALLGERDLLRREAGAARDPDLRVRLDMVASGRGADRGALERVQRTARSLVQAVQNAAHSNRPALAIDREDLPGALLALAFPDRVAQHRGDGARYLLANGRGAAFAGPTSLARSPYLVAVELDDREREARLDLAVPLSLPALQRIAGTHIREEEEFGWDARSSAVLARRTRRFDALILDEQALPVASDERAIDAMIDGVRAMGLGSLPWDDATRNLQARLQFVQRLARSDLAEWPASDDEALLTTLRQWLAPYLAGVTRREHLTRVPLAEALLARLDRTQRRAFDTLAPTTLTVPTGSQIRIDYLDDNAPCIAVRLQEVFGLLETPRIGGGAVPITFKLLSPAQRPVQITRDLAGFWRSSYAEVRKDMRGRYPKHEWPENPAEAAPTRGAKRRPARD